MFDWQSWNVPSQIHCIVVGLHLEAVPVPPAIFLCPFGTSFHR